MERTSLIRKDSTADVAVGIPDARSLLEAELTYQGGQIFVKNEAGVETGLIRRILSPVPRLPFRLAILLSNGYLPHRLVGIDPGSGMLPRRCLVLQKDPGWLASRLPGNWDFVIHIAQRTCMLAGTFPVYFALSLLQEVAHARIAHRDLALHMVHCMLFDLMWNDALARGSQFMEHEIPGERQCVRAALKQARLIFGPRIVDRELVRMSREPRYLHGGELGEYADGAIEVDADAADANVYEDTRRLAGLYAGRLLRAWKFERPEFRKMLLRRDLKRIIGQ